MLAFMKISNNFLFTVILIIWFGSAGIAEEKKLEIIKFDILILDNMMPGESGLS